MNYKLSIFGAKKTTKHIVEYIHTYLSPVDLVGTVSHEVSRKNHIADFLDLSCGDIATKMDVFAAPAYSLDDPDSIAFFQKNNFDIGISMGWQRLIPKGILSRFKYGVFGFHGSCGYLPFGRGRSPMNWSLVRGDTRFILNLFQYDAKPDSPNVFQNIMFEITPFDDIATLQCKSMLASQRLIGSLLNAYEADAITIKRHSRDFDSWYDRRKPEDGFIDFRMRTREIHNLVRGVSRPFPGAFSFVSGEKVIIWHAIPFDSVLDFSAYAPGEIIDVFERMPIVRTVDGSLLMQEYEAPVTLEPGMGFLASKSGGTA